MEATVESYAPSQTGEVPGFALQLLGPMVLRRDGADQTLPASRKVRALLAFLSLAPRPVSRSQLCDLLWDGPQDPRGELRWCLSKIRVLIDGPANTVRNSRIQTQSDTVGLDLSGFLVDGAEINRAIELGLHTLPLARLRALASSCSGEFLDGLEIERSPAFNVWLAAQRRRFRSCHGALLEHLVRFGDSTEVFTHLDEWLKLAPFDRRVHQALLSALAERGRVHDAEAHLAATARLFDAEGLDHAPIREMWRAAWSAADRADHGFAVAAMAPASPARDIKPETVAGPRRASIAVMPFAGQADNPGGTGDGLVHDIITRLAKLRNLFVIAQGSVFALDQRAGGAREAGRMLNVDYVCSGSSQRRGSRLTVAVDLVETRTARVVWAEVYDRTLDDTFLVLDDIGNRIVASIATEIETAECHRAILKPPNSLDAWDAHHRGLWHMYRFSRHDNGLAQRYFETAVALDPGFSRAFAGLSFTHFQNAFQGWEARAPEIDRAYAAAGQSLMADERDPAAHLAMGRALWLRENQTHAMTELQTAIDLSPNFALGHYALAFVHSQSGDAAAAIRFADQSRLLSPFDPLLFGMLGARAMALMRLGQFNDAAEWALRACARPNAHAHIQAIATYALARTGRLEEARAKLGVIRAGRPGYGIDNFLTAMKFPTEDEAAFRHAASHL